MTCRSTHAGSAFTTYARLESGGLNDSETLSLFHLLRRTYSGRDVENRRIYTEEEYQSLLTRQIERVTRRSGHSNISATVASSMLERLRLAQAEPMPAQDIIYALHNITPSARTRNQNLSRFYIDTASRLRQPLDYVQTQFRELYASVGSRNSRSRHVSIDLENSRPIAGQYGLGHERGTLYAITVLSEQAEAINEVVRDTTPRRIVRQLIINPDAQRTNIDNLRVIEAGLDPRINRVELLIFDISTGLSTLHAYQNVPSGWFIDLAQDNRLGTKWSDYLRSQEIYQYNSPEEEELMGRAPHCLNCGQFADINHSCPMQSEARTINRNSWTSRWSKVSLVVPGGVEIYNNGNSVPTHILKIELPAIREFRNAVEVGPVIISGLYQDFYRPQERSVVEGWIERSGTVSGNLTVYKDENNQVRINISQLLCTCNDKDFDGNCIHKEIMADAIKARLEPTTRRRTDGNTVPLDRTVSQQTISRAQERVVIRAQALVKSALDADWTRKENTLAEAKSNWRIDSQVLYSDSFEAFEEDYKQALQAKTENNGKPVIAYLRENALDGMATRESGQGFGVELEYEFPNTVTDRVAANGRIGRALHAAGLTPDENQHGYHSAQSNGYPDTHANSNGVGNWSLERDGSVNGGELVSPTMYDEPETWEKLEKAVKILRDNGAIPTVRAGGHVHVGTGLFGGDPTKYAELSRLMTQHEDVIYRLASEPERGTHRGIWYAAPSPVVPIHGFSDISSLRNNSGGRGRAINYSSVSGGDQDHSEFRLFDSTLNPGAIQAHIKLAVAMTHAASKIAENNGTTRGKEKIGSHSIRFRAKLLIQEQETLEEESTTFRSLLDTLFVRREDKAQITALFANTSWPSDKN